jgi:hypothetical protein
LEKRVAHALERADKEVCERSKGRARILVWDALRTQECQQDIWNRYAAQLRAENPTMDEKKVQNLVANFVSNPGGVFRHGTGGAVDVTLLVDGKEANIGTAFDEFTPRAAADYVRTNPPTTGRDHKANEHRELLRGPGATSVRADGKSSRPLLCSNSDTVADGTGGNVYRRMKGEFAITTGSGTSACLTAARALIPNGAITLIADTTYYEVALRLAREALLRNWTLMSFDPGNISATIRSIASLPTAAALAVWLDQPSNWWLEAADIVSLAAAVKGRGGIVVADISVHPLVPVLAKGADVAIASLSKFPSNGLCLALLC